MSRNNEEGEYLSQQEIDAIIDEIIENEPIPAVKEHLIKYEKEYRRKRDQQKLEKHQLNEENETYDKKLADINLPSIGSYKLIDINTYSDDDLIKAKGALPKVLLMEKNSNHLEKGIKQIEKCNFTKEEREIISVYITNIIGEINPKLAKEMLENINKNEEGKGMRLGQALVDYYYEGVEKGRAAGSIEGEKKRSKENSNKSNKENAKR